MEGLFYVTAISGGVTNRIEKIFTGDDLSPFFVGEVGLCLSHITTKSFTDKGGGPMGIKDEDKKKWLQLTIKYRNEPNKKDPEFEKHLRQIEEKIRKGEVPSHNDAIKFQDAKKPLTSAESDLTTWAFLHAIQEDS